MSLIEWLTEDVIIQDNLGIGGQHRGFVTDQALRGQ